MTQPNDILPAPSKRMADEIEFSILGGEIQSVQIVCDPGESILAEPGTMNFMEEGMAMEARISDGTHENRGLIESLMGAAKRKMSGQSLFMVFFSNQAKSPKKVAFSAPFPGMIVPIDLRDAGGDVFCQRGSFLCGARGVNISFGFVKRMGAAFFGQEGFMMQRLRGDGFIFVHAGGTIVERSLSAGETLTIDTGCIVAYESSVDFSVMPVRGMKNLMFAGEDFFLSQLRGPGKVWIQTMPFDRQVQEIAKRLRANSKRRR